MNKQFVGLSSGQSELLTFCVMAGLAKNEKQAIERMLDAVSEFEKLEALRWRLAMDRVSKFMSALSNLLKKISGTADSITQNIK